MKKQFEILEQLNKLSNETNEKISALRKVIDEEFNKLKLGLLNAYDNDADIMYLIHFDSYCLIFYKATKEQLTEVVLSWYKTKQKHKYPTTFEDAEEVLKVYENPSNCEIRSYQTFGYFDDVKKRWDRIDWIAEHVQERKFLYEIDEKDFIKSIQTIAKFNGAAF
jgi:HSP90 family molecular chaperone